MNTRKTQALRAFESGNPGTRDFEALGLPFEAFLRWCHASPETRRKAVAVLLKSAKD